MSEGTWTCPGCGRELSESDQHCPTCRITQIHRSTPATRRFGPPADAKREEKAPEPEAVLPTYIKECRYSIVIPGGGAATWTSGSVYVITVGFYFLSDRDGLHTELQAMELAKEPPSGPKRLANLSVYVPLDTVTRLVRGQFTGNFLEMRDLRIPLRFSNPDWTRFIAAAKKLGVKVE